MTLVTPPDRVLVTGATGYIGGRLVPRLLERGFPVRAVARDPRKLVSRPWRDHPGLEVVEGDVADTDVMARHLEGCAAAYYLVHSMKSSRQWIELDRRLAESFRDAAGRAEVGRILYLGGLGEMGDELSDHLRSRREVESILGDAGVPLTTFRAAMIIGSGSASFEILRYLVERLPIMVTPRWVRTESQPIAVRDVLHWLIAALGTPGTEGRTLELGGRDVLPYRDLMQMTAEVLGLRRRIIIPLPVLTPGLSSRWIGLVTPVTAEYGRPLAEGLRNRVVVTDPATAELMPHPALSAREAIELAVRRTATLEVETRWSAAGVVPGDPDWAGGTVFTDARDIDVAASPAHVFRAVCRIGGGHGWYAADLLWRIRGWMDQLVGGPGLRRGRRHPEEVEFGETLDFWRVADVQRDRRLGLRAEMWLPGEATLTFAIEPSSGEPDGSIAPGASRASGDHGEPGASGATVDHDGSGDGAAVGHEAAASTSRRDLGPTSPSRLHMTARFQPRGLLGLAYWYAVLPFHHVVFSGMLNGIRREAERTAREETSGRRDGTAPADRSEDGGTAPTPAAPADEEQAAAVR